jgi:hypothetical protein
MLGNKCKFYTSKSQDLKLWGAPPRRGAVGPVRGRAICIRDIFILKEIWAQDKIYFGKHFAWFKYEACFH